MLQPVAHILLQVRESVHELTDGLTAEQFNGRPAGVASVTFHVRHIPGVIDRLFTYARGESLSERQFAALRREGEPLSESEIAPAIAAIDARVDDALAELTAIDPATLGDFRGVGRDRRSAGRRRPVIQAVGRLCGRHFGVISANADSISPENWSIGWILAWHPGQSTIWAVSAF